MLRYYQKELFIFEYNTIILRKEYICMVLSYFHITRISICNQSSIQGFHNLIISNSFQNTEDEVTLELLPSNTVLAIPLSMFGLIAGQV